MRGQRQLWSLGERRSSDRSEGQTDRRATYNATVNSVSGRLMYTPSDRSASWQLFGMGVSKWSGWMAMERSAPAGRVLRDTTGYAASLHLHHTPRNGIANQSSCARAHQSLFPSSRSTTFLPRAPLPFSFPRTFRSSSPPGARAFCNWDAALPRLCRLSVWAVLIPTARREERRSDSQTLCPHSVSMAIVCTVQRVGRERNCPAYSASSAADTRALGRTSRSATCLSARSHESRDSGVA